MENNMLKELQDDLSARLAKKHNRSDVSEIKSADTLDLIETASPHVVMGIRKESTMAAMVGAIGHRIRSKMGMKKDSVKAAKVGAFVLESFVNKGLVKLEEETNGKHTAYYVHSEDEDGLTELWELIPTEKNDCMPQEFTPVDWSTGVNPNGLPLIRHAPRAVLAKINKSEHGIILNAVNKMQAQGWTVDKDILKLYIRIFNNKELATYVNEEGGYSYAFDHIDPSENRKARSSKRLESNTIRAMAKQLVGKTFYHSYNLDFRGRIYPTTAFLHEQGSDRAKGLLRMESSVKLGQMGAYWLAVYTANMWGEDKLPLDERVEFVNKNMDKFIGYADDPLKDRSWLEADKCWSFISCCAEWARIDSWVNEGNALEDYECDMPVFVDGSNNGVQHLTALSLDETVAPLVNLVPQDIPGDVYMYIADKAWAEIQKNYDPSLDSEFDALFEVISEIKAKFDKRGADFKTVAKEAAAMREDNKELIGKVATNYWMKVSKAKTQRKVCKRPVMTLGYGGTKFGFKQQIVDDTKSISGHFRYMEYVWAGYLGTLIYNICRGSADVEAALPGPAKMLELFETLASRAVDEGERFGWKVPMTNFEVVQQYRRPNTKRVRIAFCGSELRLNIKILEDQEVDKAKQITAAAPNVVHSFDAAHLTLTVEACKFPTATVHDSFGCLPGDMDDLFFEVRNQFVRFYNTDPLVDLLDQRNALDLMPLRGSLNLNDMYESDFAFA